MIHVRFATPNDREKWNYVAEVSNDGTIFHTWEWCEVIEQGFGDRCYRVLAEENGKVVGIFPLFARAMFIESKYHKYIAPFSNNFQILWSPHPRAWGYGAPIIIPNSNINTTQPMIDFAERLVSKNKKIVDWRISPSNNSNITNILSKENGYTFNARQTSIIELDKDADVLWGNLNKKTRNGVRQAKNRNVEIVEASSKSEINELYAILCRDLYARTNIQRNPYSYFKALWDILVPSGKAKFLLAKYDGKLIGSLILLYHKDTVMYEHNASLREYARLRVNNLLTWTAIEESIEHGFKLFDMGGMPHDEKDGIYRYKNGWGGNIKKLGWYRKRFQYINTRDLIKKLRS